MKDIAPLSVYPVPGLPEIRPGDDLAALLARAVAERVGPLESGDVVVVAQKVVSKAEGARVALAEVTPSAFARDFAERWEKDPRLVELVLRESLRIVRMERGVMITETRHGFVCANSGVDLSNTGGSEEGSGARGEGGEIAVLLPEDPDQSAARLREGLGRGAGAGGKDVEVGVIVSDTFGRPWRVGLTQVALGVAGLAPLVDLRDTNDVDGRPLHATIIAMADQLACAADLVCGKTARVPAAVIRGYRPPEGDGQATGNSGRELIRDPAMDLFR